MIKPIFIFILVSTIAINAFGKQSDYCRKEFDKLLIISNKTKPKKTDLENSWLIAKKLYNLNYTNYIDSVANGANYSKCTLSETFCEICNKVGGRFGVRYCINYLNMIKGSALDIFSSLPFDELFSRYPEIVLDQIGKNRYLLDVLIWGFYNCRRFNNFNIEGRRILNEHNCKYEFFKAYPSLKVRYNEYKYEIDYIINATSASVKNFIY